MPSAEIITIGTEMLLGEIVDTNTRYIARILRGLGIDLYRTITIGDNVERIAEAIHNSMKRAEIVITTGGLGPTVDDPTREAVARAVGVDTEFREELWAQVVATISKYGRKPSENQKRQAYVPKGAIAIPNPVGTAPSFIVETDSSVVISLPGVPREMEHLMDEAVIPYLQERYTLRQVIKVRVLHTAGLGEGMIDEKIDDLEKLANPTVGLAAHTGVVDIRIAAKAETEAEADAMIKEVEDDVRGRLANVIFGADDETLELVTLAAIERRNWTLTVLEHGLPGSLARRLPGAATLADLQPGALPDELRAARKRAGADAALGIAAFTGEMAAEIMVITPRREKKHRLTYGGPPRSLATWAYNAALNLLRVEERAGD